MKLLFDQNISLRLVNRLADIYPNASHLALEELGEADDEEVWNFAKSNNYIIVTKDIDFTFLSMRFGFPPKVVWVRLGNCTTSEIEALLRDKREVITAFHDSNEGGILALF